MASSPLNPKLLKGGLFRVDRDSGAVSNIVPFQYNPESVSRSLTPRGTAGEGQRADALRLIGPPVETINIEIILEASRALETAEPDDTVATEGLAPQLALLEMMIYPSVDAVQRTADLAAQGLIEVLPEPEPLTLLAWSRNRITPVKITEFSVTEEAFDTNLNPIRLTISLGLRVMSIDDLGASSRGGGIFMSYFRRKSELAGLAGSGDLAAFGISQGDLG
ncbi:MAG: hypothetical protein KDC18_11870 [Alphaproteobacteria bacterium]|nr:hypothetical protein [Alphaproteobacteria bacterium]MCB9929447.1 hypothetical protein [Alphaproteobacteria bacterium]